MNVLGFFLRFLLAQIRALPGPQIMIPLLLSTAKMVHRSGRLVDFSQGKGFSTLACTRTVSSYLRLPEIGL
jgi:hypothetical protein